MKNRHFDQLLGSQRDKASAQDKKLTKNILDAYIKELPEHQLQENQRIGIKLQMETYLSDNSKATVEAGEFLNKLFAVYDIKKSKFADYIGVENANLHALLKGRRKFNSKIATKVGNAFGINPELWMFIEAKNELKKFNSMAIGKKKTVSLVDLSHNR